MGFLPRGGASSAAGTLIGLPTAIALRAHPGVSGDLVALRGYTNPNEADQGLFQWDPNAAPDNGVTRFNAGAGNTAGWQRVYSGPVDIRWGGATGDGVTNDTVAVQRVLDTGLDHIRVSEGTYLVGTVTPASTTRRIDGPGTLKQRVAGAFILAITGISDLVVENVDFIGVPGNNFTTTNHAIQISDSTNITVKDCSFATMQGHAVHGVASTYLEIANNHIIGCSAGLRFTGCEHFRVHHNTLQSPQYTLFTVAIGVDSINEVPHTVPTDFVIDHNLVENYIAGQAVLMHAGVRGVVHGNVFNDVLQAVSAQPFMVGDTMSDCIISDNTGVLTLT